MGFGRSRRAPAPRTGLLSPGSIFSLPVFGLLAIASGIVLCLPAAAQPATDDATQITPADTIAHSGEARLGGDQTRTRFVIGLEQPVKFQVFSLANPNRVIVELPDTRLQLPEFADGGAAVGLVKSFRAGAAGTGRARVVIDVTQPVVVEAAHIEKGRDGKSPRLALDIVPAETAVKKLPKSQSYALAAAGLQPPLPKPAVSPKQRAAKAFRPTIVIDPGHGGHDSGATKNGTVEKDVVLAFAKVLRDKLEKTGRYRVLMTRDDDTFVELDERRAFAERHNASLFIAVHADYAQSRARGATIFSLREHVADELKRSAKDQVTSHVLSENEVKKVKDASGDVATVHNILADLAEREVDVTKERTSFFSRALIEYMGETTDLRDNPDQQAAFRVLKTAQFPSVLIELAYVTNKQDAENLRSDAWRSEVAGSIQTAVDNYFSNKLAHLPL